jgi:hypothetical protein
MQSSDLIRILDGWDQVSLAIDRIVTALPQQMTHAAENLEARRREMRALLHEIGLSNDLEEITNGH